MTTVAMQEWRRSSFHPCLTIKSDNGRHDEDIARIASSFLKDEREVVEHLAQSMLTEQAEEGT